MNGSHPWQFEPKGITDTDAIELRELCGHIRVTDCDDMSPSLAKHFKHDDTGERGKGKDKLVDPNEAYNRAMKVCG